MTTRNAVKQVPAVTTKNMFKGSSIARSCATACAMALGLLVAGCTEPPVEVAISEPDPDLVFVRGYSHLTAEERDRLAGLKADGLALRAIAKVLGRAASTFSRELRRKL
jgi:type IV pilus biogenesis protein CpaD/CtpE